MSRLSIRARLTLAFTGGLLLILVAIGAFVYVRVDDQLLETIDASLRSRFGDVARDAVVRDKGGYVLLFGDESDETFSQVVGPNGRVLSSTLPESGQRVLSEDEVVRARSEPLIVERTVPGLEEESAPIRILAGAVPTEQRDVIAVVGTTTDDHREALAQVRNALLLGFPAALVISALIGYLVAGRALAPVERMRRRASEITLARGGERLPLPNTEDEIWRLGETLNEMLARIEASVERQRAFVSDASHELRTPLAVLKAELELAGEPARTDNELRVAISSAADEVDRLARLADDLLVLARSDQGELTVRREPADPLEVCERVALRFSRRAAELGRRVAVEGTPEQTAPIDVLRVEQAVGNLIDNALRHGKGTVTVSCREVGGELILEVSDEGAGMPAEFAGSAFERFTRADTGRSGGGAGLGLSIVQAIAEAHGGRAEIEGPAMRLRLPI